MYVCGISGQHVGLTFISAFSGTPLTGLSGLVSGYKIIDGAAQAGLSGYITEGAFGQYVANLFAFDVSGSIISYYFTAASGAIPVEKTVVTTLNVSGYLYTASGIWPASGAFAVTSTTLSGQLYLASGSQVLVYSGQLSGQPIAGLSGFIYPASGVFTVTSIASGSVYLASGSQVGVLSGQLSGQPIAGLSGFIYPASGIWPASGAFSVTSLASGTAYLASGQAVSLNSGQSVLVYSGQLSGQPITLLSGYSYTASGIYAVATSAPPNSGTIFLASGHFLFGSGQYYLNSGQSVLVYSGQLSGQPIAGLSGFIYPASGVFTVTSIASGSVYLASGSQTLVASGQLSGQPIAGLSGFIYPASGVFTVTSIASGSVYLASGSQTLVASGQLSGQPIAGLSGQIYPASGVFTVTSIASGSVYLASGSQVLVYSGQLSGQPIAGLSGQIYTASGIWSASGTNVATTIQSGTIYLASGQAVSLLSGQSVLVYSGQLSGQPIAGLSGFIYPASGVFANGSFTANSGLFVTVPTASISGVNALTTIQSGTTYLASGSVFPDFMKGNMSGLVGEPVHSPLNAARKLVCHWDTTSSSGYLTVYKEDAITTAYQQALTSQSGAAPVTALGDA